MSFIDEMRKRYTTKKYNPSKRIEKRKLEELKEILWLSPSSLNSQPWKFVFVSDKTKKEALSKVSFHNDGKVTDCDTVVVFTRVDNMDLFEELVEEGLAQYQIDYYYDNIKPLGEAKIKEWFDKQVYLSVGILLAACADMQIDATPMEGVEAERYDELLGLKDYSTVMAVAIGYRDAADFNQPSKKPKRRRTRDQIVVSC